MRGGARINPKAVRYKRDIEVRDDGAKQLATEVIVQAVNDVRLGVMNGWLTPEGTVVPLPPPVPGASKLEQWRRVRKATGQFWAASAAGFLRNADQLGYWLGLCQVEHTPRDYALAVFRQLKKEVAARMRGVA